MLSFFESTWPFWWIIAIVVLIRWFHVNSLDGSKALPGPAKSEFEIRNFGRTAP